MYGIYAYIWGVLMVNVSIYTIHGAYGYLYENAVGYCRMMSEMLVFVFKIAMVFLNS